ncbi:MAG: hypothetical protein IJ766_02865 [Clostridia bacterium]|nr:hypothetical protein [Clostridia bacterium]
MLFGKRKNSQPQAMDIYDDFDDFSNTASAGDMTGLIPGNNGEETAAEFYDDVYDYLPKGVRRTEKYGRL